MPGYPTVLHTEECLRETPQMTCIAELAEGFHPKSGVRYTYTAFNEWKTERNILEDMICR